MISRISGKLIAVGEDRVTVYLEGGVAYDLLVPSFLARHLLGKLNEQVEFFTYHYLDGGVGGSNLIPRLVGFPSAQEREFFEKFITVPDIGVRKALRCFVISTSEIATAIEMNDLRTLEKLPGIGKKTAQKIVVELKDKVAKYALIKALPETPAQAAPGLKEEVTDVLLQLGYNFKEAEAMIEKALKANPDLDKAEALLQAVYKQRSGG